MKNPPWRTGAGFSVKVLRFFALEHGDQKVAVFAVNIRSHASGPVEDRRKWRRTEFEDGLIVPVRLVSNGTQLIRYYYR